MLRPFGCTVPSLNISLISSCLKRMLKPRHKRIPRTWTSVMLWPAELKCPAAGNPGVLLGTLPRCSPIRLLRLWVRGLMNSQVWHRVRWHVCGPGCSVEEMSMECASVSLRLRSHLCSTIGGCGKMSRVCCSVDKMRKLRSRYRLMWAVHRIYTTASQEVHRRYSWGSFMPEGWARKLYWLCF